jgi:hypothetical protein
MGNTYQYCVVGDIDGDGRNAIIIILPGSSDLRPSNSSMMLFWEYHEGSFVNSVNVTLDSPYWEVAQRVSGTSTAMALVSGL